MSGGSFDYLYRKHEELLPGYLEEMVQAIERHGPGSKAAIDARALLNGIVVCRNLWEHLAYVMRAVEWEQSGDWGDGPIAEEIASYEKVKQ